jgi:hypothetical protein
VGLDQYAFSIRPYDWDGKEVDFKVDSDDTGIQTHEVHYWRKHPNLHGWMEALYWARGGEGIDGIFGKAFNCRTLRLTAEDLDALEKAILADELPPTSGFFFGETDGTEKDDDLHFVESARAEIEKGNIVFYDSWW